MFYFAVLEFVHFTISSTHTPNRNAVCVGVDVCAQHAAISCSMCIIMCMCQKGLQQIHMYLINADDNTPEVWKKQTAIKKENK